MVSKGRDPVFQLLKLFEGAYNSREWNQLGKWFHPNVVYVDDALSELQERAKTDREAQRLLEEFSSKVVKTRFNGKEEFRKFAETLWAKHPGIKYRVYGYNFGGLTTKPYAGVKGIKLLFDVHWAATEGKYKWHGIEKVALTLNGRVVYERGTFNPATRIKIEQVKEISPKDLPKRKLWPKEEPVLRKVLVEVITRLHEGAERKQRKRQSPKATLRIYRR